MDKLLFLFSNNSNLILICVSKKSKKTNYQTHIIFIIAIYFRMFLIYSTLILWYVKQKNMNLWTVSWDFKYLPLGKKGEVKLIVSTNNYDLFFLFFFSVCVNVSIKHATKKRKTSIDLETFRTISLMKVSLSPKFIFVSLVAMCLFTS